MEKQELYHIHKLGNHNKIWKENNEILVKNDFKSAMAKRYNSYTTGIKIDDAIITFHDYLVMNCCNDSGELINMPPLSKMFNISYYGNMFKRETALENFRRDKFKNLPSRLHSIYLTDKKGIDSWIERLNTDNFKLYRVEATGNIFKTNEQLLPLENLDYEQTYKAAYNYWNPNFKKVPDDANEYLVQGKVKILEKIK